MRGKKNTRTTYIIGIASYLWFAVGCQSAKYDDLGNQPKGFSGSLPNLYTFEDAPWMSWIQERDSVVYWIVQNQITLELDTVDRRSDWFINWADFPKVYPGDSGLLALALRYVGTGTYAYTVDYYIRPMDKDAWIYHGPLPEDQTLTEHGFPSAIAYRGGWLVVWLDGRNNEATGFMGLRSAEVKPNGGIEARQWVDTTVCDCCQTAIDLIDGLPQVVYRNRTKEEVRDIYTSNYNGQFWNQVVPAHADGWTIAGCPVNGPQIAGYQKHGATAWFTAPDEVSKVKLKLHNVSNAEVLTLDDGPTLGRIRMISMKEKGFAVAWMGIAEADATLQIQHYNWDGLQQSVWSIPHLNPARGSGFPTLSYSNEMIWVAWTQPNREMDSIQLLSLPVIHGDH